MPCFKIEFILKAVGDCDSDAIAEAIERGIDRSKADLDLIGEVSVYKVTHFGG